MDSCKIQQACKLGGLTRSVQVKGGSLSCAPSFICEEPSKHKIMVIVKAPDLKDTGGIGQGRNIEKLKDLINDAGISADDIYVTGLVKCAPPSRNPTVQEIKICMGHLADELRIVDPDVVVLMGSVTLRVFNLHGQGGVNSIHGKLIRKKFPHDETLTKEYGVIVTTDPNILYMNSDPKLEGVIIQDLRVAKSIVNGSLITPDTTPTRYKLISNPSDLEWMVAAIEKKGVFAFDTESRTFPWFSEPMICMSFCWGYNEKEITAAVLPFYNHDPDGLDWKLKCTWNFAQREQIIKYLKKIFENPTLPKIAHNIKYDMCVVRRHTGICIKGFLFDPLLMHHLLWEHYPHSLEYLADLELGTGDYSKELHDIVGHGKVLKAPYDHVPDEIMWPYTAKDAECAYRLMAIYYTRLKAKPHLWKLYLDEVHPFIRTLFKAEWFGAQLDSNVIGTLTTEFKQDQEDILIKIRAETWPEFKPSSPDHVATYIKRMGHYKTIADPKKASGYSTAKPLLLKLANKLPLVEDILKYRNLTKLTGNYMTNAKAMSESRARISVKIHGTVNGRPSAGFLHQIPRLDRNRIEQGKGNLRDMFIPDPGKVFVYGDFSQIELVILAIQSGDEEMMNVFKSGADIHTATAGAFLNLPDSEVNDHNRGIGKAINFARVYGAVDGNSLLKLTYLDAKDRECGLTPSMVKKGFDNLDARFPAAARYFEDTVNEICAGNGIYITRFGREKRMGGSLNVAEKYLRMEAERQAVNGSVQSPAAAVTVRTLNLVDAFIEEQIGEGVLTEEDIFLIITVHDSGLWEVTDSLAEWFVPHLRTIAERKIPELDNFQFTMKIGVGKSWSEAELNAR